MYVLSCILVKIYSTSSWPDISNRGYVFSEVYNIERLLSTKILQYNMGPSINDITCAIFLTFLNSPSPLSPILLNRLMDQCNVLADPPSPMIRLFNGLVPGQLLFLHLTKCEYSSHFIRFSEIY